MTSEEDNPSRPPPFKITLIPGETASAPGHGVPQIILRDDGTDITDEQLPYPVPSEPLHLCPQCGYILTGLKTRRCPECGELFDLTTARRVGGRELPRARQDRRAIRIQRISAVLGSVTYFASLIAAAMIFQGRSYFWNAWCAAIGMLIIVIACVYKIYFQRTWSHAAVAAGVIAALFAGLLMGLTM